MEKHRVFVAGEALRADRALRRALLRQPTEAREDESTSLEEIRDEGERENTTQTEPPRLGDAREHELSSDTATRRLWLHGERTHLREVRGEHGERAASQEARRILGDDEIAEMLEEKVARPLEHPVLGCVAVDERPHVVDVLNPRGTNGDAHSRNASVASASASRTRSGAVPPGDAREASEFSGRDSAIALASKPLWYPRSSSRVRPPRSVPCARRSRTIFPTTSCASRKGTPRFARWSARSVAVSIPRSVARRVVKRHALFLKIGVVREWQALDRGQDRDEISKQAPGATAYELGDIGILFLRHDARPGRVRVRELG